MKKKKKPGNNKQNQQQPQKQPQAQAVAAAPNNSNDNKSFTKFKELQARLRSAHRENAQLKSRIAQLEQDKADLRKELFESLAAIPPKNTKMVECSVSQEAAADLCDFCNPHREGKCPSCQHRLTILPSILSLLVKNSSIGAEELCKVACTNSQLRRFYSLRMIVKMRGSSYCAIDVTAERFDDAAGCAVCHEFEGIAWLQKLWNCKTPRFAFGKNSSNFGGRVQSWRHKPSNTFFCHCR